MSRRLHIYLTADIKESVLNGVEIRANCGLRKVLSAEDVDEAALSQKKACARCLEVIAERTKREPVTLAKREGWDAIRKTPTVRAYTVTIQSSGNTWPMAG